MVDKYSQLQTKLLLHNQTHQQFSKGSLKRNFVHVTDYKIKIRMRGTLVKHARICRSISMREYPCA